MNRDPPSDRQSSTTKKKYLLKYLLAESFFLGAILSFTGMNLIYAANKIDFESSSGTAFYPDVALILLVIGAIFLASSLLSFFSIESQRPLERDAQFRLLKSAGSIIAESISQNKLIVAATAAVYATIFALLDGILIYQPSVNFLTAYGVSNPAIVIENCCGPPGYIPVELIYFPSQHFGIQLIPISVMIMLLISLLVGVNVALLVVSVKKSRFSTTQKLDVGVKTSPVFGGAFGSILGVFAGCPTCAAAFFLSMIAGSGATAFSIAISEFQPVIILLSVPLLFGSIWWQARAIGKILVGCSV